MRKLTLFLSYSRADLSIADDIRKQIVRDGHHVWQDTEEMLVGDHIDVKIRRNLRNCDGYVVLITPNSLKSPWVLVELGGAWVSGIQLFPVIDGIAPRKLPFPLRDLNFCRLTDVPTKLLPALSRLVQEGGLSQPEITDVEINEVVNTAASSLCLPKYQTMQAIPLVRQALSSDRANRRVAHTAIRQGAQTLRGTFLEIMALLADHPVDHVRGEAYYCLGDIPLNSSTYVRGEDFFRAGLSDESSFVQACCANVLKNFVPLVPETIDRLQECLTANIYRMQTTGPVASLVYYAAVAINAQILRPSFRTTEHAPR